MQKRYQHRQEVIAFLQNHLSGRQWHLTRPASGRGHETYIAHSHGDSYFVKVGATVSNYQIMAAVDLTPAVILSGHLDDGTSILVQPYINGRNPSWQDFRHYRPSIAAVVNKTHHNSALKSILAVGRSETYKEAGETAVKHIQQKWALYRSQLPGVADYIDETLAQLKWEAQRFIGGGLVASHNDICSGNWLITTAGKVYLVDLEMMSLDDPAHDMGALLWWYYSPELRSGFLESAGYQYDNAFKNRMRVRMALHCLNIILPREQSFDSFDAGSFAERLTDFRAVLAGKENPRGYVD
ncbi:MAG: aminoglycoside phosphotransferase family protein [Chloroflexota bacterium]